MRSPEPAPIAIFAYNRPDRLRSMLRSLMRCEGFHDASITVFIDGPKDDRDAKNVAAVCSLVSNLGLDNVTSKISETNRGLRTSIYSGVTEIIRRHGRVIVLEDDLVLSRTALNYFNAALQYYANNDQVWSVAGYIYDAPPLRGSTKSIILPFTHPWGWATWERAWTHFSLSNSPQPEVLESRAFRTAFDMGGLYPFTKQLENSIQGRVNSWYIHWYYTIFQHRGLSIFPPNRLIENLGLNRGSHGGALNPQSLLVERPPLLNIVPEFDTAVDINYPAIDALRNCRELRVQRFIARAGSAKRNLMPSKRR